jgi:hypothetical protein
VQARVGLPSPEKRFQRVGIRRVLPVYRSVCRDNVELHVDEQGGMMARKDLEKEAERPRYYSQFWLDVAAGRRVIGQGKGASDGDEAEGSEAESAPEMTTKAGKASKSTTMPPIVEAEPPTRRQSPQPLRLSGTESLADLVAAAGLVDVDSSEDTAGLGEEEDVSTGLEPLPEVVDADLAEEPVEEPYSFTDLYDEEEEEDEEEDEEGGWSSRRTKKHKKPEKPRRREKGRDF